jgi:polar amino acid transport system substrate-binding protein
MVLLVLVVLAQPAQPTILAPTGTLRGSFIASNPVQGRVDAQSGTATGPAPDLVRELARRIGLPSEISPLPDAAAVLESVISGRVDIGFLALEIERAAQVDFSDPYANSGAAYAVRANAPFKTSADVDRAGVKIGAVTGQSPEVYVRTHAQNARVESLPAVPTNTALGQMLIDGRFDAFAANRTRMEELAREAPGLRVLSDDFMMTSQAIVVPKGNQARLSEINRFLADVRASGFVKMSLERAKVAGVSVAPEPGR